MIWLFGFIYCSLYIKNPYLASFKLTADSLSCLVSSFIYFLRVELLIEMAANGMFGAGKDGMINPPDPTKSFTLSMVEIAVFNRKAYKVICDLKLLLSIIKVNVMPIY